jgi:hypothetical protein
MASMRAAGLEYDIQHADGALRHHVCPAELSLTAERACDLKLRAMIDAAAKGKGPAPQPRFGEVDVRLQNH